MTHEELSRAAYLVLQEHYRHVFQCPDCRQNRESRLMGLRRLIYLHGIPEDWKPEGFIEDSDRILRKLCAEAAISKLLDKPRIGVNFYPGS